MDRRLPRGMLELEELRAFADERHGAQLYGSARYVFHLDAVREVARRHALGEAYERAAYGHDLLDDTDTPLAEIVRRFGSFEGALILSVSARGQNRAARRRESLRRLDAFRGGIDLKVADRIANVRASLLANDGRRLRMYLTEVDDYEPLFARGRPAVLAELTELYAQARAVLHGR